VKATAITRSCGPALDVMALAAKQCRGPDRPLLRLSLGD
jgi:hypothetical protein